MDNVLFVPATADTAWLDAVLPLKSPAELPVAGRRFIDYALEYARKFDTAFMEVLDSRYSKSLEADFSEPTKTGFPVFYVKGPAALPKGLADMEGISSPLTGTLEEGLFAVWGLTVALEPTLDISYEPLSIEETLSTPPGVYRIVNGRWNRVRPGGLVVDGLKSWHKLNFIILHHPGFFTLPGYSAEKDVRLGRNVVMERGTEVKAPALLQDDVWCARNVSLEGDVIIGAGSFIGEGAVLKNTVVCDDTFIGEELELEGKIVAGSRVIDPEAGVWTDVDDAGVASRIGRAPRGAGLFRRIVQHLARFFYGTSSGRWV